MSLHARLFAATYDRVTAASEEAGVRDMRRRLLSDARGRVVEIGSGTGVNVGLYPGDADVVFTEPDEPMARRCEARLAEAGREASVVRAPAEALGGEEARFDVAVSTLVLCTVPEPEQSLAELRRVLRPGGRLLFLEHVRSEDARVARWQDRLRRPWRWFARGCECNRATLGMIEDAGFRIEGLERTHRCPGLRPSCGRSSWAGRWLLDFAAEGGREQGL